MAIGGPGKCPNVQKSKRRKLGSGGGGMGEWTRESQVSRLCAMSASATPESIPCPTAVQDLVTRFGQHVHAYEKYGGHETPSASLGGPHDGS